MDALIPRLAAAYGDPGLLRFHLDDAGSAAGRSAELADPSARVSTQDKVLAAEPPTETLAAARAALEKIAGTAFPAALSDADALLIGTGRRTPTDAERSTLGGLADRLPLVLG